MGGFFQKPIYQIIMYNFTCQQCGISFTAKRSDAKFCTTTCRALYWQHNKPETNQTDQFRSQLRGLVDEKAQIALTEPALPKKILKDLNPEYTRLSAKYNSKLSEYKQLKHLKQTLINEKETLLKGDKGQITLSSTVIGTILALKYVKDGKKPGGKLGKVLLAIAGSAAAGAVIENATKENRMKYRNEQIKGINDSLQEINVKETLIMAELEAIKSVLDNTDYFIERIALPAPVQEIKGLSGSHPVADSKRNQNGNTEKRLPPVRQTSVNVITNEKIINSTELSNMDYQVLNFEGKWRDFFGQPSVNFHYAIHGKGKSTFAIQFNYLAENIGIVVYISGEEGFSKTMKDKLKNNNAASQNLYLADLRTYPDLVNSIKPDTYHFIIIDSLDNMRIDALALKELRKLYSNSALITISQSTKDGKIRGSYEIVHDSDITVEVGDGKAITVKNRFLPKDKVFNIFESDAGQGLMPWNTVRG
jgi:hypothetical protein